MNTKTTKPKAKPETLTPEECERRQRERLDRAAVAVRTIKRLDPKGWRADWVLHTLDWLETKAATLREEAEAKKAAEKTA